MKTYAADNLMFLREQYPAIYNVVRNRSIHADRFRREETRGGSPNLVVQDGSTETYLYSKYDPILECERWAATLPESIRSASDVLLVGVGLGYHALALAVAYPDKRLYLYEPDIEMFIAAVETIDLRPLLKNKQIALFAVGDEESVKVKFLVGVFKAMTGTLGVSVPPPHRKLLPQLEADWGERVSKVAHGYSTDVNTIAHHTEEWIENVFVNLKRNFRTPNFYPLKGVCEGIPAVIAGSGPSLGIEAERLRELQDKAFIIAAGTAAAALLHLGITPHLIVSMDPGEPNRRAFAAIDASAIPFLYFTTIKHSVIKDDHSPYLMHGYLSVDRLSQHLMEVKPEDGLLVSTSSVTGTAIQIASFLGCPEITFIGQDFSYPNDQIYAEGVSYLGQHIVDRRLKESQLTVRNVKGGLNRTNASMNNLRQDVEFVMEVFPHVKFYNASPVGAVIEHAEPRPLSDTVKEPAALEVSAAWFKERMAERLKLYPEERRQAMEKRALDMHKNLQQLEKELARIERLMSQPSQREAHIWLGQFEAHWKKIVDHALFQDVLSFYLTKEKDHAERYWGEMYKETNQAKKQELLKFCTRPLVQGLRKLTPQLLEGLGGLYGENVHSGKI
ncbi:motility associated factor glycosyltransferase family protein [Cohnella hongkongensis]|uniref:Motility associated factor glycosyltransferase family protein n=1 Tax=Cohnella hongkongensis TaxID=178337 RepID=A0ABV9FCK3_9BACL